MKKIVGFLFLSGLASLNAQPVITGDDIPAIGYQAILVSDSTSPVIVDVGKAGGPRTWDFSKEVSGDTSTFEVLDPKGTPWDTAFPKAEFVYHMTNFGGDSLGGDGWQYLRVTPIQIKHMGMVINVDTNSLVGKCNPEETYLPLPLDMGSSWNDTIYISGTINADPAPILINYSNHQSNLVDAWGTVKVPKGTFEALRVLIYDTTYILVSMGPIPVFADTSYNIQYEWLAKDVGPIALISSRDGEQNLEFDTAASYSVLVQNNISGVEEVLPASKASLVVSGRKIEFETALQGTVEIAVYDILGRRLDVISLASPENGKGVVNLPEYLSKGVYFIKMRTGRENLTAKAVVLD